MRTTFIEVTQGFNWGKFMVAEFEDHEWAREAEMDGAEGERLLGGRGWGKQHWLVVDLQTGEGAIFMPLGDARSDLNHKHQIWVCPMFEPFLVWLYQQPMDLEALPPVVRFTAEEAPGEMYGYRRGGPNQPQGTDT